MRWHRVNQAGRIEASADTPEALESGVGLVFSDAMWRGTQYVRALRDVPESWRGKMEPWAAP